MTEPPGSQRSFKLVHFNQPLCEVVEPLPTPTGTEVLLRVSACGVCHSDLHLSEGYFDLGGGHRMDLSRGVPLPLTLGHEIAGEVVALGPEADGTAIGDRRVVFPWIGCGHCALCRDGQEHLCARPHSLGTTAAGGFSDHVLVPHPRYLLDHGALLASFAATLACSGLTAFSALRKARDLNGLLVIGAGGVGLAGVAIAKALGGAPIVADIDPAKRQAALEAGASEAVDPADPAARKRVLALTDGGVATAIDFVGAQASAEFGLSVLRKGGRLVVVGLFGGRIELPVPTLPLRAIALEGSFVGSLAEMRDLLALARDGALSPIPIETRRLDQVSDVLDELRAGRIRGRAVLTPAA